jgi:pimeloyl-ACP methyl ester carboxylesterase
LPKTKEKEEQFMKLMKATLRRLWRLRRATSIVVGLAVMVGLLAGGTMAGASSCDTVPTGVATEDYFLNFKEPHGLMPDPQFGEIAAKLHVHRVRPVYANGKCSGVATQAAVLIHGRTTPGPVVFDLPGKDSRGNALSVQEGLARAGIDTFAPSLVGYGKSTRFSLDNPENASLGPCPTDDPAGCDSTENPMINPLNQQEGKLIPNPLAAKTAHTSNVRFARTDVWVRDIDQVINHALSQAKPTDGKVALVGYSAGGVRVGRTLYAGNPLGGKLLENRDKMIGRVSRVVFVSSLFGGSTLPNGQPFIPTEDPETGRPTFPLTLEDRAGSDSNWQLAGSATDCPDRIIPGTQQQVWDQTMAQDPLGSQWGSTDPTTNKPSGLNRAPTFSNNGWNPEVAGQLSKPTLIIQGLQDGALSRTPTGLQSSQKIYSALTAAPNKVLVEVQCASHALPWEGADSWAGPHYMLKQALIEWIKSGTFNDAANGHFIVDKSGGASAAP